jgi:hypothetical protein
MSPMRPLLMLLATALVLTATATAADPIRASMSTTATTAVVGTPWRYTIAVSDQAGRPLAARVRLQALRGNLVVACWRAGAMRACSSATAGAWIALKGERTGTIRWPASSVGTKLSFQATLVTGTRSLRLRAPVTVRLP